MQPWKTAGPAGFDFGAHYGQLCFIMVGGCHPPRPTQFGVRSGVRCTIVFLDAPMPGQTAGEELYSVLLWGQRIVARLRNCTGQTLLHRLIEGQGTGANKPNDLADPSPADEQLAMGWVNFYPGRLEQLMADAVQDFDVQERALLAQERGQSQGSAARAQAQTQPQYQQAQPQAAWQLNNQHQPVQHQQYQQPAQPQYAQPQAPMAPQPQYAQQPTQPQYAQQPAQPPVAPQYAQPQYAAQPPPPPTPPPPAQPAQQGQQQGPPWHSAVVPGGVPATPAEAGY